MTESMIEPALPNDPVWTVYSRLLWRHMEAARQEFDGEKRRELYDLIKAFRKEFPAETSSYEAEIDQVRWPPGSADRAGVPMAEE